LSRIGKGADGAFVRVAKKKRTQTPFTKERCAMSITPWFDDLPVLGALSPDETIVKLREVGEEEVADALEASLDTAPSAVFGLLDHFRASDKPYLHTAHAFGYVAPVSSPGEFLPILPVSGVPGD